MNRNTTATIQSYNKEDAPIFSIKKSLTVIVKCGDEILWERLCNSDGSINGTADYSSLPQIRDALIESTNSIGATIPQI
jgi:hypothetical protein